METIPNTNSTNSPKITQQSYIFLTVNKGSLKKVTLFYSSCIQAGV